MEELERRGVLRVEDGNHGEYRPRSNEFGVGTTAFIRAADMAGGRVLFASAEHISDEAIARIHKGIGRGGDILFSHKGTVGKLARVPHDAPPFVCSPQTTFWRTLDEGQLDREFLYAFMRSTLFSQQWTARKGETDMADYVSLTAQRQFWVAVPSISEQRSIGRLLGALDDKIDLNRRIDRTLEEMAAAIFRSWFVEFEPVMARAAGRRAAGMDPATAALFPAEFENTEFGQIPKGWQVGRLGDLIQLKRGYDLPTAHRQPGQVPIVSSSGPSGTHSEARVRGPGVVTGRYGTIGQVFYIRDDFWPLNTTLYVHDFRGTEASYAYHLLRLIDFHKFSDKAAVPGINRNHVHNEEVVVPPRELRACFARIADHLLELSVQYDAEVRTLMSLYDTLLAKFLSGQIRLRDAERAVEAVA